MKAGSSSAEQLKHFWISWTDSVRILAFTSRDTLQKTVHRLKGGKREGGERRERGRGGRRERGRREREREGRNT